VVKYIKYLNQDLHFVRENGQKMAKRGEKRGEKIWYYNIMMGHTAYGIHHHTPHYNYNKKRKEWEIKHQLVIENKCCENKIKNVEF
jgi:hypothetical protein